jgi:hypothetical protein
MVFGQQWDASGMIDVSMREYEAGNLLRIKGQMPVFFFGFFSTTLKHTAVQQYAIIFSGYQMHRTGNFPSSAVKRYIHSRYLL